MTSAVFYRQNNCNLRCKHCGVGPDLLADREPLCLDETRLVLDNLKRRNISVVTLVGGEPFLDPDIFKILDHAEGIGLRISINTNLTTKIDFEKLVSYGSLSSVVVSVDSAHKEIHDKLRGTGSYDRTVDNIGLFNAARKRRQDGHPRLEISFVLSDVNASSASDIFSFARRVNAQAVFYNLAHPIGFAKRNAKLLMSSKASRRLAYEQAVLHKLLYSQDLEVQINVPPRFAEHMSKKYSVTVPASPSACGGVSVYEYVDLHGNSLPCPAMAFEESRNAQMNTKIPQLSLAVPTQAPLSTELFEKFESDRRAGTLQDFMRPCSDCRFRAVCRPCTSDIIRGEPLGIAQVCDLLDDAPKSIVGGQRTTVIALSVAPSLPE